MKRHVGIVLVVTAVLAGCIGPLGPQPPDEDGGGGGVGAPANSPPSVDLTAETSVFLGDTVTANLVASDPEDDPLTWLFEVTSTPDGSSATSVDVDEATASFTPDMLGDFVIRVSVSDGTNEVAASVTITVISGVPDAPSGPQPTVGASDVGIAEGLDWDDTAGATSYEVYLGVGSLPGSPTDTVAGSSWAPPSSLSYSTTYVWRIVAVNEYGSTEGPQWSFTTQDEPLSPPSTPSGPSPANGVSGVDVDSILNWADATNAAAYDLRWRVSGGGWTNKNGLTQSQFNPGKLAWDTTYEWQVTAKNAAGSSPGPIWSFTTQTEPPASFDLLTPKNGETGVASSRILLDWQDSSRADEYDLYLGVGSLPGSSTVTVTDGSSYLATGLQNDTTYLWRVIARNAGGGTASPTFSFHTELNAPAAPSSPSPPDGADDALPDLTFDWADSQHATSYDVWLRLGRASFTRIATGIGSSSFSPTGLSYGSNYEWYVVARNAEKSTTGPTWSFRTQTYDLDYQLGGHWPFDGHLGDLSIFAHHGEWRPEPAYTHQVPGSSPVFATNRHGDERSAVAVSDVYKQYVIVPMAEHPDSPLLNHTNGFSLSLWFYDPGDNSTALPITRADPKAGYELNLTSGSGLQWIADGEVVATIPEAALNAEWNHVVVSWNFDSNRLLVWANGERVLDVVATPFTNSANDIYFGPGYDQSYFTGALDDIRIYYRAISETEASALYEE